MKTKMVIIGNLFVLISLISCNKGDDDGITLTTKESILGKWQMYSNSSKALDDCDKLTTINFSSAQSVIVDVHNSENEVCVADGPIDGSYSIDANDNLNIVADQGSLAFHIDSITSTNLVLTDTSDSSTIVFKR